MKDSISITTIFQIFILFVLLFTAIMCLTINNSNAFGVKDSIVNAIESLDGNYLDGPNLNEEIVKVIQETSYRTSGTCPDDYKGFDRAGNAVSSGSSDAAVCIKEVQATKGLDDYLSSPSGGGLGNTVAVDDFVEGSYYKVMLFFQLDIPIMKQVFNFNTTGETRIIYNTLEQSTPATDVRHDPYANKGNLAGKPTEKGDDSAVNPVKNPGNIVSSGNSSSNKDPDKEENEDNPSNLNETCTENIEGIDYTLKNIDAVAFHNTDVYVNYDRSGEKFSAEAGKKFKIIGEDSSGKYWAIDYQGKCGWVENIRMGINAEAYIPNANFSIANASSSKFKMLQKNIPYVTGEKLYNSEYTIVPLQYHFAKKVKEAAQNASQAGYTLVIYDAYRPASVSRHVASYAKEFYNNNADVRNAFRGKSLSNYIASGGSLHNKGCAVDVTISGVTMPTEIHELTPAANGTNSYTDLLDKFFSVGQVKGLNSEWWHFESTQNCLADVDFWSAK